MPRSKSRAYAYPKTELKEKSRHGLWRLFRRPECDPKIAEAPRTIQWTASGVASHESGRTVPAGDLLISSTVAGLGSSGDVALGLVRPVARPRTGPKPRQEANPVI